MTCSDTRARLPLLLYGDLPPAEASAARQHLAGCPACQTEYATLERLRGQLDALASPRVTTDLPRLYQEAARQEVAKLRRWRRVAMLVTSLAAAILLLTAVGLEVRIEAHQMVFRWGSPPPIPPPTVTPPAEPIRPVLSQEQLALFSSLIHALKAEGDTRDDRVTRQDRELLALRARVDTLQRLFELRWGETERTIHALYLLAKKGDRP